MWQRPSEEPSYDNALRSTFNTTYRKAYRDVDTIHSSPVYTEHGPSVTPVYRDEAYGRNSYPYQEQDEYYPDYRYEEPRQQPQPRKRLYDYNKEYYNGPMPPEWVESQPPSRPYGSEYVKKQYNEVLARPEEKYSQHPAKNACVACRGSETQILKCTNMLGCSHRYCDVCMRRLQAADGPFRDKIAMYYYCGICRQSRTPAPKIIKFDPYGRRIMKFCDQTDRPDQSKEQET